MFHTTSISNEILTVKFVRDDCGESASWSSKSVSFFLENFFKEKRTVSGSEIADDVGENLPSIWWDHRVERSLHHEKQAIYNIVLMKKFHNSLFLFELFNNHDNIKQKFAKWK